MSFRSTINKVLVRLREDTITSDWSGAINDSTSVDDYHKLVGEFVNEAKTIVEDAWNCPCFRITVFIFLKGVFSHNEFSSNTNIYMSIIL